jgi:hypothetical protein
LEELDYEISEIALANFVPPENQFTVAQELNREEFPLLYDIICQVNPLDVLDEVEELPEEEEERKF